MNDQPPERLRPRASASGRVTIGPLLGVVLPLGAFGAISSWVASVPSTWHDGPDLSVVAMVAAAGLILLNAVAVAGETAVNLLRPAHLRMWRDQELPGAEKIERLLEQRENSVAALAFAGLFARFAMAVCCFVPAPRLAAAVFGGPPNYTQVFLAGCGLVLIVGLVNLIVGEVVPRSYASANPVRAAARLATAIRVIRFCFIFPARIVSGLADLFTARFGLRASFEIENRAEEEIKEIVETATVTGELEVDERELFHNVIDFSDTVVREVMTPRADLDALPVDASTDQVVKLIRETGHSRIPLYEGSDDQIVGILHAKELLMAVQYVNGDVDLRAIMLPPIFVPETMDLLDVLKEMRAHRAQMVIVQDEFGGTAGIATVEDVVEELVGDIVDEYDVEEPDIEPVADGLRLAGRTHLDDVNEALGSEFESEEFDTIGGYVFGLFGYQPKAGESLDHEGYRFTILETDGKRIGALQVTPLDPSTELPGETIAHNSA